MQELDDMALLREYVERDSEEAFAALITRHVNRVYSVALRHTNSGLKGLTRGDGKTFSSSQGPGGVSASNQSLGKLAEMLEETINIPVINQTAVRGVFDCEVSWQASSVPQENLTALNQALGRQMGLELVPTNMPIEMLVVDKAKF